MKQLYLDYFFCGFMPCLVLRTLKTSMVNYMTIDSRYIVNCERIHNYYLNIVLPTALNSLFCNQRLLEKWHLMTLNKAQSP